MPKKKASKRSSSQAPASSDRKMLAPIWLDELDQQTLEELKEYLWARSNQNAFLHSLRWACRQIEQSKHAHKPYVRDSDRAFADGKPLILRLTPEQREYLDEFVNRTDSPSTADAVRVIIRMAAAEQT